MTDPVLPVGDPLDPDPLDPDPLEPDDSAGALAEANMATVGDDEYFQALRDIPPVTDESGDPVDPTAGVLDERDRPSR